MKKKLKMSYLQSVSVLFLLLLLDTIVLADYENTWNSYFEQPCCNSIEPHYRHHKGEQHKRPKQHKHKEKNNERKLRDWDEIEDVKCIYWWLSCDVLRSLLSLLASLMWIGIVNEEKKIHAASPTSNRQYFNKTIWTSQSIYSPGRLPSLLNIIVSLSVLFSPLHPSFLL